MLNQVNYNLEKKKKKKNPRPHREKYTLWQTNSERSFWHKNAWNTGLALQLSAYRSAAVEKKAFDACAYSKGTDQIAPSMQSEQFPPYPLTEWLDAADYSGRI